MIGAIPAIYQFFSHLVNLPVADESCTNTVLILIVVVYPIANGFLGILYLENLQIG